MDGGWVSEWVGERERERGESGEGAGVSQVKVSLLGAKVERRGQQQKLEKDGKHLYDLNFFISFSFAFNFHCWNLCCSCRPASSIQVMAIKIAITTKSDDTASLTLGWVN